MDKFKTIHAISEIMADVGWNLVESIQGKNPAKRFADRYGYVEGNAEFYTFSWRKRADEPKAWVRFKILESKAYALKGLGGGILCSWDLTDPKSLRKLKEWAYATAPNK